MFQSSEMPIWAWVVLAILLAFGVMRIGCEVWKASHRSPLLDRARAHASNGIRLPDEAAGQIHLHKAPWMTEIHVPRGWLTDAEAASFAGDIARIWGYNVRSVRPARCWQSLWLQAVWSIRLGKNSR